MQVGETIGEILGLPTNDKPVVNTERAVALLQRISDALKQGKGTDKYDELKIDRLEVLVDEFLVDPSGPAESMVAGLIAAEDALASQQSAMRTAIEQNEAAGFAIYKQRSAERDRLRDALAARRQPVPEGVA